MNKLGSDLADAWLNKKLVDLNKFNNNEIPKTREEAYKALNIFYKKLNKNGRVILSGILKRQKFMLLNKLRSLGLILELEYISDNWITLLIKKN